MKAPEMKNSAKLFNEGRR